MTEDSNDHRRRLRGQLRTFARGQANRTPFVAFFGVNFLLLALAAVLSLIALLAWWLAS